jgi:hypothetical protein
MFAILHALEIFVPDLFKSRSRLEAENVFLRHQLNVALRRAPSRLLLRGSYRALLVWIVRRWPSLLSAIQVIQPETILRWHRAGFRVLWRWKSRNRAGRLRINRGLRDLIRRMSLENPLWGASRIHGELLKLGFEGGPINRLEIYGATSEVAVAIVEDVSAESCGGNCRHRYVRCADADL